MIVRAKFHVVSSLLSVLDNEAMLAAKNVYESIC